MVAVPRSERLRNVYEVIATAGLHGSASTWVYNAAREIMLATRGQDQVLAIYADQLSDIPEAGDRSLIIKSHHGGAELDAWLVQAQARILLSIRDPRDAALSMAERFNAPLSAAAGWLVTDCVRMQRLMTEGHPVFRYEDRFFDDPAATARVAALLEVDLEAAALDEIAARYRPEAVRRFIQGFDDLPRDRIVSSEVTAFDTLTHIHRTHIGTTASGKWRRLSPADQAWITSRFAPFLEAFGYPLR